MKFLIITDDSGATPEKAYVDLEANQRWLNELKQRGILEEIYSLAGNHGVVMIVNVESGEQLDEVIITGRTAETKITIHALANHEAAMKLMKVYFKRTLASMKKAP